jgi:Rrf2 family nitric oxide-sensitive transcriptional repressor
MHLTTFTDYSLRVLMFVAAKDGQATIDEIARGYGISRNHLMKVVYRLGQLGYLTTVRGKGGGITLARPPAAINIGAVVRQTEEDLDIVECFQESDAGCAILPACVLKGALGKALGAFMAVLDGYTLADLIGRRRALAGLLRIPASPGQRKSA